MRKVNFGKNFTTTISGFFQYDYGQIIDVYNTGTNIENLQFEFVQDGQQITVLGTYHEETDSYTLRIPDSFLQKTSDILAYIYYEDPNKGQTIKILIVKITPREKYESIPDPQHHSIVEQILEELARLQDEIDHWSLTPEQIQQIVEQVESEIDLDDYYDKQETDDLLDDKADKTDLPDMTKYYNKTQTDNLLSQKANASSVYTKTEINTELAKKADKTDTYTKQEVDNLIPDVSGLATKQELTQGLAGKANSSDVYTKQEVDNLIPDVSGLATKQELTTGLSEKADKSDTYTKQQVDNLIPDVSGFATKQELTNGLAGKANAADVYTKTETDNLLSNKANAADVYTKTQVDNLLPDMTNYYTKTETYSKTEIDSILGNIQTILEGI
jgi:hypothetical protein